MKLIYSVLFSLIGLCSCAQKEAAKNEIPVGKKGPVAKNEAVAYFAEGCFWHTEIVFQSLAGVRDAISGYAGGTAKNPDYETVSSGQTGHAETVKVIYDPSVISYETLVDAFFASHNPTTLNRQGPDEGTQYRSIAFYSNNSEKATIEKEMAKVAASGKYKSKIVTQVVPLNTFWPAEDYHQEYISHNPENPYVANVNIPDYLRFRKEFRGPFKK